MARTITKFNGSLISNSQTIYTCPVGKIAKVQFRCAVNSNSSTASVFGSYDRFPNYIYETTGNDSFFYVGDHIVMMATDNGLQYGGLIQYNNTLNFVASVDSILTSSDLLKEIDKDSLILVENETIRFEETGGGCNYNFLLFEEDV